MNRVYFQGQHSGVLYLRACQTVSGGSLHIPCPEAMMSPHTTFDLALPYHYSLSQLPQSVGTYTQPQIEWSCVGRGSAKDSVY